MLIKCPECELQASDKAQACPHCGYPFQSNSQPKKTRKSNKRRRLPNSFGQISEIKNRNLRKPFRAMVTVGKNENGRPICKPLKPESYFRTYNEAYTALVEYNKNPYDIDSRITMSELFERWCKKYFEMYPSGSSERTINTAWAYCSSIYDMKVVDIRARHIKGCMNDGVAIFKGKECKPTAKFKSRIKSMFNLMLDYALEFELVDRNYARTFNLVEDTPKSEDDEQKHIPFAEEEIEALWDAVDEVLNVDAILIQCYSGWRPQELITIKLADVNMEDWTFIGGMKTPSGISRMVPIHSKIQHLVKRRYEEALSIGSKFLINCMDTDLTQSSNLAFTYSKYQKRFTKIMKKLDLSPAHRPHDPRMHFVTIAKKYNVDEYAIKYLVGHKIKDITEKVYTARGINWLRSEIEKIK